MVAAYCQTLHVPHAVLYPAEPIDPANVQAGARSARYLALGRWAVSSGVRIVATAHHADDQAETFLMRVARGSGVAGLSGIRARQTQQVSLPVGGTAIDLIRPLLEWRAADLRQLVHACAVPFVDDPSNADRRYDRTHFRRLLAANPVLDPAQIARSAAHAAEADAALRAMEAWLWQMRKVIPTDVDDSDRQAWLDMTDLPRELKRRLCRAAIASVRLANGITRPDFSDASNVESLLDALAARKTATQAGVMVSEKHGIWRFSEAPARRTG